MAEGQIVFLIVVSAQIVTRAERLRTHTSMLLTQLTNAPSASLIRPAAAASMEDAPRAFRFRFELSAKFGVGRYKLGVPEYIYPEIKVQ